MEPGEKIQSCTTRLPWARVVEQVSLSLQEKVIRITAVIKSYTLSFQAVCFRECSLVRDRPIETVAFEHSTTISFLGHRGSSA